MDSFEDGIIYTEGISEATDYTIIPEGPYQVVCTDHKPDRSEKGNPVWKIELKVLHGDHVGHLLRDTITFMNPRKPGLTSSEVKKAEQAMSRVFHVLKRLGGVDISAPKIDLNTIDMRGRQAIVDVIVESRTNEANGQEYTSNKIKFAGYSEPENLMQTDFRPAPREAGPALVPAGAAASSSTNGPARKPKF